MCKIKDTYLLTYLLTYLTTTLIPVRAVYRRAETIASPRQFVLPILTVLRQMVSAVAYPALEKLQQTSSVAKYCICPCWDSVNLTWMGFVWIRLSGTRTIFSL